MKENKKLAEKRYNFSEQRNRAELEQLTKAQECLRRGEKEESEAIRLKLIEDLRNKVERTENRLNRAKKRSDFDRSVLPDKGCVLGEDDVVILLDSLVSLTGEKVYRTRVDPDNYASQGLMKRIGAQPDGLSEMFIHGEELERYQEENKDLITDRLIEVAEDFCSEPIDLIGHVLEYRIEWRGTK